jgi:hypothetical protein
MKLLILFTIICAKCKHANDWNSEDDIPTTPDGYRIGCKFCQHEAVYSTKEVSETQALLPK